MVRAVFAALLASAALPSGALAQSASEAEGQALFDQAVAELDAGKYGLACEKLERVTKLVPDGIGVRETLGECYEKQGKLASAWTSYAAAEALAMKQNDNARARAPARRAAALAPRLARLRIEVPAAVKAVTGLKVALDGAPLEPAAFSAPRPVDKGNHEVSAEAPGYAPFRLLVPITEDGEKAFIVVGPLGRAGPGGAARGWQLPVGVIAGGVGLAGMIAGGLLGALAIHRNGQSNAAGHCNETTDQCDAAGGALRSTARTLGVASTAAFVAGAALLAGGVTLAALAPKSAFATAQDGVERRAPALALRVHAAGLSLEGAW